MKKIMAMGNSTWDCLPVIDVKTQERKIIFSIVMCWESAGLNNAALNMP
jgi:hypothetical protein